MYEKDLASGLANIAVRRGVGGFTFDDLARAATRQRVTIGNVADWLANERASGFLEDVGFDPGLGDIERGPRRYRMARANATAVGPADDEASA